MISELVENQDMIIELMERMQDREKELIIAVNRLFAENMDMKQELIRLQLTLENTTSP